MKKKLQIISVVFLACMLIFSGCQTDTNTKFSTDPLTITFIETTDVHGALFPYDFITGKTMDTSLAQVASIVEAERATGNEVILLDNGDTLQGQPTVYYYNFEKTNEAHIWSQALNYLQYDAVTVGNHDIEAGHPVYDKMVKEVKAPFICANIEREDTGKPYFEPYTIINRQGVKIAVIGLIEPKLTEQLPQQFWSGMKVTGMVEAAQKWIPLIQKTEKPDLIVGLFHAGVDYTYGGQTRDTPKNESASQLVAEQVNGFDIIFVGHDHTGWSGQGYDEITKGRRDVYGPDGRLVPIYGGTANASSIPVVQVEMTWDPAAKTWNKKITGELKSVKGIEPDPAYMAQFSPYEKEIKDWVDRPIATMGETMTSSDALFGDSAFVDLIHRIQLELSADPSLGLKPAQISIVAPLDQNATINKGVIRVRDMFSLYKFENFLYTMDLTGKQIVDFLEYNYGAWFNTMKNENDHLINFLKDPAGNPIFNARYNNYDTATRAYNYDTMSGINYTVDVSKPAGSRVTVSGMADGTPFDLNKTYSVAINSYRASGGGGHLTKGVGIDASKLQKLEYVTGSTTKDLRYFMLKWFEKQSAPVAVKADNNWKVIPENWAAAGKKLDYPLFYPVKK